MRKLTPWFIVVLLGCSGGGSVEVVEVDTPEPAFEDLGAVRDAGSRVIDVGVLSIDVPPIDRPVRDVQPNPDAFFASNPPPRFCGPDGSVDGGAAVVPGGTPECPEDLLREGCPCTNVGETRPCWPGLRVNRNRGVCRDGTTTCMPYDELGGRWGACQGYVLPTPGARLGPAACQCFSQGRWELENLSPCFVQVGSALYAVSTYLDARGQAQCPMVTPGAMPAPQPGTVFSANHLTVDCAGQFQLCFTIRAGNAMNAQPSDCVMARVCTSAWYPNPGARLTLPPLPAWTATDTACVRRFYDGGGYGEMTVVGLSRECERIDDGAGGAYTFLRVGYCPLRCNMNPSAPECRNCANGGNGMF